MVDLLNPNFRGSRGGVRIRYPGIYRSHWLDTLCTLRVLFVLSCLWSVADQSFNIRENNVCDARRVAPGR